MAAATDKPTAALLKDLKSRGLLEDTLVLWTTEFGRMPFSQGSDGRDHNGGDFCRLDGRGRGETPEPRGESDEWSWKAARDSATNYDFHATFCTCSASITRSSRFVITGRTTPHRRAWGCNPGSAGVRD